MAITIRLDPGLWKQLDRMSRELGRTRSEIVREALRRHLALNRPKKARRQEWLIAFWRLAGAAPDFDLGDRATPHERRGLLRSRH